MYTRWHRELRSVVRFERNTRLFSYFTLSTDTMGTAVSRKSLHLLPTRKQKTGDRRKSERRIYYGNVEIRAVL